MYALAWGVRAAVRQPLLTIALYGASLLGAAGPAAVFTLAFWVLAADRPWGAELTAPGWANVLIDVVVAATPPIWGVQSDGRVTGALSIAGLGVLVGLLAVVGYCLAYAFLAGGVLERLRGRERGFWSDCRHWFWPFVWLGLLGLMVLVSLSLVGLVAIDALPFDADPAVETFAFAIWLSIVDGSLELARAWMVVSNERRPRFAVASTVRHLASPAHLGRALIAWAVLGVAGLLLFQAQLGASATEDPTLAIPGSQAMLVAGAWLTVARLGTALALANRLPTGPRRQTLTNPE